MLSFEEQLWNLQESEIYNTEEKVKVSDTDIIKQMKELTKLLIQAINTATNKTIDYKDSRVIEEIQINCIEQLKDLLDILKRKRIY